MTQDEIIEMANQASKEWLKEFPTPEETAHQVPKRFLEIFAKLVEAKASAKEREACAKLCEEYETDNDITATWLNIIAERIRARGQA
jgi:hypothetical protein